MLKVIIMVGLPCSGKSTIARKLVSNDPNLVIVCPDTIRLALHGDKFNSSAEPMVWCVAEYMAKTLLISGRSVIIDATNTTAGRRRVWRRLAYEFDAELSGVWVKTSEEDCLKRNGALMRLPDGIIQGMARRFEDPDELECVEY